MTVAEKITDEELIRDLVRDDHEDYEHVQEIITGQSRWMTHMETIVRRKADLKLFMIEWDKPSTENSGETEYPSRAHEVTPYTLTTVMYKKAL